MSEIKKYYDTDLIGSGGGYTMTEIEKLAFEAGAHAVIELIRERMPGRIYTLLPSEYARGFNAYRSEILKLLDNIK